MINFWATWCKPCTDELAAFADLRRTYGDAVALITISAEDPGVARAFLQARDLAWPVVEDPDRKIFDAYSVGPIPVTIVLDRAGRSATSRSASSMERATGSRSSGGEPRMRLLRSIDLTPDPAFATLTCNAGTPRP